jgi:ATP-dependent Lon protease
MIQDVMSVVCKSNAVFKKHRASERSITIQVTQPHESFLSEGLSLSLAAAAALYAAFEDVSLPDDLVMSGCLEITGRIGKVSHVREKAALAVQQGKTQMILAAENRMDV